jgi:predicted glycosyltransferase
MYGLGLPMICISDSPHAEAVSRLTLPLTSHLLSPAMISKQVWTKYGIREDQITQYNAFDQVAWLTSFSPDKAVLSQLQLDPSKPIVTIRVEEAFAAYYRDKTDPQRSMVLPVISKLRTLYPDAQIVALPRYAIQVKTLKEALPSDVRIPESVIDATSLISFSTLFIGAGGTMTIEAVLLGIPAISFYAGTLDVESWLEKKDMLYHANTANEVIKHAKQVLTHLDQVRHKAQSVATQLMKTLEDPIATILSVIDQTMTKKPEYK